MPRSVWKGPFIDSFILKHVKKTVSYNNKNTTEIRKNNDYNSKKLNPLIINIWSRRSIILPEFIGLKFKIHNGKSFINLTITEEMIGHKFGEFSLTRKKCIHKN